VDLTKDDKERGTSPPIGGENTSPYYQIAKNMGMGHNTYTKCKYVDKHGTEDRNEAKKRQGSRNDLKTSIKTEGQGARVDLLPKDLKGLNNIALNSARSDEDMTQRTDRKLAKNIGKLSSESFRLLKICRHYMQ
jgi:hypothetical protein